MQRKKILVVCPYPEGQAPSQRLKYEQYFPYFKEAGYEVHVSSFMSAAFWKIAYKKGHFLAKVLGTLRGYLQRCIDLFRLPFYDIVYIHLWVTPFGPPVFERLFAIINGNILYDIDDMIFLGHQSNANALIRSLKGKNKPLYLMKKARHVIVCTPKLDSFVQQYNSNTTDISSTINMQAYIPVNTYTNAHKIVIGWSGSHSTVKYLHLLDDTFRELKKSHDFHLFIMGVKEFEIEGVPCEVVEWTAESEVPNLQKIDIGVYPLPDEDWVYGKSGLKALQYMALGIPTIATAIGANHRIIENGVSGFLVKSKEEWLNTLKKLIDDQQLRKQTGQKARERVMKYYSLKSNKDAYLNTLQKVDSNESQGFA